MSFYISTTIEFKYSRAIERSQIGIDDGARLVCAAERVHSLFGLTPQGHGPAQAESLSISKVDKLALFAY